MTQLQQDTIRKLRKELYERELHIRQLKNRMLQLDERIEDLRIMNDKLFVDKNVYMVVAFIFCISTIALSLALWRF